MDKHYIENEKKRTTTCIINNHPRITNHPNITDRLMKKGATIASRATMDYFQKTDAPVFVGVARCHKLDTPNTTTGHRIASNKADLVYHKAMAKDLKNIKNMLIKEIAIIEALENHESQIIDKTNAFIKSFTK